MYDVAIEIINKYQLFLLANDDSSKETWKRLEEKIDYLPVYYQYEFIQYQKQYFGEKSEEIIELSLIIRNGLESVGLWPMLLIKANGHWAIGSAGTELLKPVFTESSRVASVKARRKIYRIAISFLREICNAFQISSVIFSEVIFSGVDVWHRCLMEIGAKIERTTHLVMYNLLLSEDNALKRMHRTTKQTVEKGRCYYDYRIITGEDDDVELMMEKFRLFHIAVSGRETRSRDTWKRQIEGIRRNRDFAVFLFDKQTGAMDGAALFTVTKSCCYYSVAVYNRDKFDRPIGHVIQDVAIKKLRELGVRWYIVGDRFYPADLDDKKMLSISEYKEAFSTDIYLVLHLNLVMTD